MATNDTDILKSNELADVLYNAFLKALEDNEVKFNQRSRLEEMLKKELSSFGNITEKEQAKIRATIENGFKKGGSVKDEVRGYFKELIVAVNNNEKNRIQGLNKKSVSSAYPQAEKIYRQRDDSLRRASLGRYNRVNEKLNKTVDSITENSKALSDVSSSMSKSIRSLTNVTDMLITKATKLEGNITWLESAASSIGASTKKSTILSNSLIGQSIKLDKQVGWVESSIDSLKSTGKKLGTFRRGLSTIDRTGGDNDSGKKQEEDSFISSLVKKLENSKLGSGFKTSLLALGGALAGSFLQQHGHPILAKAALVAGVHPIESMFVASQASKLGGGALKMASGTRYGGMLNRAVRRGLYRTGTKWGAAAGEGLFDAAASGTAKVGSKLIPGLGAVMFGIDSASRFKKGDKLGGSIAALGAAGSAMSATGIGAIVGEPLAIIAGLLNLVIDNIKPIGKAVGGLFNMFKPAGEFIAKVFGGIWKWLADKLHLGGGSTSPTDHRNFVQKSVDFAASAIQHGPVAAGRLSKAEAIKKVSKNSYYESIAKGGKGWGVDANSFINDIMYAKSGTNEIMNQVAKLVPGLKVTSALGTASSPHAGKLTSTGHYSGTKLDFAVPDKSEAQAKAMADKLRSTGYFSQVTAEFVKGQGYHVDAQVAKSKYAEIEKREKDRADAQKAMVTPFAQKQNQMPQLLPMASSLGSDVTGNESFARMQTMNNYGRD